MDSIVKNTRISLGLSLSELAQRMGMNQTSIHRLEINEARGTAKIGTIQRALQAMGKEGILIAVAPVTDGERAAMEAEARKRTDRISATMGLEGQRPSARSLEVLTTSNLISERIRK